MRRDELVGGRAARQRVGVGKEVTLEILRLRIELADGTRLRCRGDELGLRAESPLFEDGRHLADRETFTKCHRPKEHVAPYDLVHDRPRGQRRIETVFAGLQPPASALEPHRHPKGGGIGDDARVGERARHALRVAARDDLDERLGVRIALVRALYQEVDPRSCRERSDDQRRQLSRERNASRQEILSVVAGHSGAAIEVVLQNHGG